MKQLTDLLDTFRNQAAEIMETMQEINRLASVHVSTSHSKRIEIIQHIVADHYGLPGEVMHSKVRARQYVVARQVAMHLCRELTNFSLADIAQAFRPDMDHNTISHSITCVAARLATDKPFAAELTKLRALSAKGIEDISMPLFAYARTKAGAAATTTPTTTP
jgi:chromosomal replication initiation ATPase DnaA